MVIKNIKDILRKIYYYNYFTKFQGKAKNVILSRKGFILNPDEISFEENIFIGRGFYISAKKLEIGSNIMIGPNVLIECSNHQYDTVGKPMYSYSNLKSSRGIKIENDVWIGGNVTILDGVTIGEGCVVGASSNVIKSLPPYTICVGNPCKPIKKRFHDDALKQHLLLVKSKYSFNQILKLRNPLLCNETAYTKTK